MIHDSCHEDIKLNIYAACIDEKTTFWLNRCKSITDFQKDMRLLVSELKEMDPDTLDYTYRYRMSKWGYIPIENVVSDVFHAKLVHTKSRLVGDSS